jgi:exosortase
MWSVALALLGVVYYPTMQWLVTTWLGSPYYEHGFVVPVISLALVIARQRNASVRDQGSTSRSIAAGGDLIAGGTALVLALAAHMVAQDRGAQLASALTLVLALAGLVLGMGGRALLSRHAFSVAFLLFMIPLPWLERLTPALARGVATMVVALARGLGMDVVAAGARIELPRSALVVGAPCSGVNSLAALVTLGVLYAFVVEGPPLGRVTLALLAVPLALLANLARVLLLLLLAHQVSVDVALGFFHDWSSPFLFVLAVGLLVTLGRVMRCNGLRVDI